MELYVLDTGLLRGREEELMGLLSPQRREKAERLRGEARLRSLAGGLLLRRYVGDGPFVLGAQGKPSLPGGLEFKNELSGAAVDRFGTDAILVPGREGTFTVTVDAAVNEPFFAWLCTFGDGARILAPESAVNAMREHVEKILARYVPAKEGQS